MCTVEIYATQISDMIGSDLFANIIALLGLLVATGTLIIGGRKVSKAIKEYRKEQRKAVFGYHANLRVFITRLKSLTTDGNGKCLRVLYLLSYDSKLTNKGAGCEKLADELKKLAQDFLDYLSTKSGQIPAGYDKNDIEKWDNLIGNLVEYLTLFLFYETGINDPRFNSEEDIQKSHAELLEILDGLLKLINKSKISLLKEIEESKKDNI